MLVILSLEVVPLTNFSTAFDYLPDLSNNNAFAVLSQHKAQQTFATDLLTDNLETLQPIISEPQLQVDLCLPSALPNTSHLISALPLPPKYSKYAFILKVHYQPGLLRPPRKPHAIYISNS